MKNLKTALKMLGYASLASLTVSTANAVDVGSGLGIERPSQVIRNSLQESFQERENSEKSYKENEAATREPVTLRTGEKRIGVELDNGMGLSSGSKPDRLKDWAQPEAGYKEKHLQKKLDRELKAVKQSVNGGRDTKLAPPAAKPVGDQASRN